MADITMCKGTDCIIKEKCYRYTAKESKHLQSWFIDVPFEIKNNKFTCTVYWGDNAENIFNQIKNITNDKVS